MVDKEGNAFVKLAMVLGIILLLIILLVLIFAKDQLFLISNTLIWGFVVLGVVLGAFILKAKSSTKKKKK